MSVNDIEQSVEEYYNREHGFEQKSTENEADLAHIVVPFRKNVLNLLKMFKVPYSKKEGKSGPVWLISFKTAKNFLQMKTPTKTIYYPTMKAQIKQKAKSERYQTVKPIKEKRTWMWTRE